MNLIVFLQLSGANEPTSYKYLDIAQYDSNEENFVSSAIGGFSTHKEVYDVALWCDKKRGLYIIPFFETFIKCFDEEIENKKRCIKDFLTNDKIPPSVIKFVCENKEKFFDEINSALGTDFSNLEEILFNTKTVFLDEGIYSPVITLFNSDLFSSLITVEKNDTTNNQIGRNEACPCGSGKKYKNCCLK